MEKHIARPAIAQQLFNRARRIAGVHAERAVQPPPGLRGVDDLLGEEIQMVAIVVAAQYCDPNVVELGEKGSAGVGIVKRQHLVGIVEQIGCDGIFRVWIQRGELGDVGGGHIYISGDDCIHFCGIVIQLAGGVYLHRQVTVGLFLQIVFQLKHGPVCGRNFRLDVGILDDVGRFLPAI